jgi:hypothetical protein
VTPCSPVKYSPEFVRKASIILLDFTVSHLREKLFIVAAMITSSPTERSKGLFSLYTIFPAGNRSTSHASPTGELDRNAVRDFLPTFQKTHYKNFIIFSSQLQISRLWVELLMAANKVRFCPFFPKDLRYYSLSHFLP